MYTNFVGNVILNDTANEWFDNDEEHYDAHNNDYNNELPEEWYQHQMINSTQG